MEHNLRTIALDDGSMVQIKFADLDIFYILWNARILHDRICGLVVRVLGYISKYPGSITSATRFSGK
jgi:hypothetical protein